MELVRIKNVATIIFVPLVDADGDAITSAGSLNSQIDTWSDGAAPNGFVACGNEATEIGSTGVYYLSLSQAEMNNDYIYIMIESTGAKTQHILIRTMSYADFKATGFSTHAAADIWTAGSRELSTPNDYKADVSPLATSSALATAQADLNNPNQYKADVSSLALEATVNALNDPSTSEIDTALSTAHGSGSWEGGGAAPTVGEIDTQLSTTHGASSWLTGGGESAPTVQEIDTQLTTNHGSGAWKADVSGLAPANEYDSQLSVIQTDLDDPSQYKADVSGLATAGEYDAVLTRLLGLNGEFLVTEYVFSGDDNITLSFWQYDSLDNFNTHNKSTGVVGTWQINTTYSSGKPTVLKSKRLS